MHVVQNYDLTVPLILAWSVQNLRDYSQSEVEILSTLYSRNKKVSGLHVYLMRY